MAVTKASPQETQKKAKPKPQAEKAGPLKKQVKIRLKRSLIGRPKKQREVVKGLGLRKIDSEVLRNDCPEIRGMINKIPHLVEVEYLEKK